MITLQRRHSLEGIVFQITQPIYNSPGLFSISSCRITCRTLFKWMFFAFQNWSQSVIVQINMHVWAAVNVLLGTYNKMEMSISAALQQLVAIYGVSLCTLHFNSSDHYLYQSVFVLCCLPLAPHPLVSFPSLTNTEKQCAPLKTSDVVPRFWYSLLKVC